MATTHEHIIDSSELPPIPEAAPLAGWKEVPIVETERSNEPLVPVGMFSEHRRILSSSVYADEHHNSPYHGGLEGSNVAVFMREGVANKLEKAADLLPRGHHLMVMDAYRSLQVQATLYEQYEGDLREIYPDWTDEQISTESQKYVSLPSHDKTRPSPHNTGASVDVVIVKVSDEVQDTIDAIDTSLASLDLTQEDTWQKEYELEMKRSSVLRRHVKMLQFGTPFDHGGHESALRHYEEKAAVDTLSGEDKEAQQNRRLLYDVMVKAGFEPYADEWWHYNDPASQMGAKVAGREYAEYGAIELSDENKQFSAMRWGQHVNSLRLARGEQWIPAKGLEVHYDLARAAVLGYDIDTLTRNPANAPGMTDTVAPIKLSKSKAA